MTPPAKNQTRAAASAPPTPGDPAGMPSPVGTPSPVAEDATSYEQARDELAAVVAQLESGGLSLDESLTLWERGEHLAGVCTRFLDGARERVEDALRRTDESPH